MFKDKRINCYCLQKYQTLGDPYFQTWSFEIPRTTKTKAVYQFNRYENNWTPSLWGDLRLNERLPENIPEDTFRIINEQCRPHPLPHHKKWLYFYNLCYILPLAIIRLLWLIFRDKDQKNLKKDYKLENNYVPYFVTFNFILYWVIDIALHRRYKNQLKERVKSLTSLITDLNNSRYLAKGFRIVLGNHAAWLELQLLDEEIQMAEGRVAAPNPNQAPLERPGTAAENGPLKDPKSQKEAVPTQEELHMNTPF